MTKEEMIRRLVAFSVHTARQESKAYWLQEVFEKGFAGYRNFSYGKLKRELELRGLDVVDEDYADDDLEDPALDDADDSISALAIPDGRIE